MKLERSRLGATFDPDKLVTTHEIYTRKSEVVLNGDERIEQKKFADNRFILAKNLW